MTGVFSAGDVEFDGRESLEAAQETAMRAVGRDKPRCEVVLKTDQGVTGVTIGYSHLPPRRAGCARDATAR